MRGTDEDLSSYLFFFVAWYPAGYFGLAAITVLATTMIRAILCDGRAVRAIPDPSSKMRDLDG